MIDFDRVYPYVVPAGYVEVAPRGPEGFVLPVGHDVFAMLVEDRKHVCAGVLPGDLEEAGLSAEAAHGRVLSNLERLARGQSLQKSLLGEPGEGKFMLWTGHWLAASCIRLPRLFEFASAALESDRLCVSIPQRETTLLFRLGSREKRDWMRRIIYENEK